MGSEARTTELGLISAIDPVDGFHVSFWHIASFLRAALSGHSGHRRTSYWPDRVANDPTEPFVGYMQAVTTIGLDIAKSVFQLHGAGRLPRAPYPRLDQNDSRPRSPHRLDD